MGDKKRASLDETVLQSDIKPVNKQYIDEYIEFWNVNGKGNAIKNYKTAYDRVFRFRENWDIDFKNYNNEIYMKFQLKMLEFNISTDRIDFYTSALSNLGKFLQEKYPNKFDRYFLNDLERINSETSKNIPPRALKMHELDDLKEFLRIENNNKAAYIFYIYYHYDIKKADFIYFNPININLDNSYFSYKGEALYLTNEINEALNKGKKFDNINISSVNYYFEIMTEYLQNKGYFSKEQTFTFDNVKLTRNRYRMKCPCCGQVSENTADNWVIIRFEKTEAKQIVCKKCRGENYNVEI